MFITRKDLLAVYDQLKDKYDLIFTNTASLNEGFSEDIPVIVGKAHGQIIELYTDAQMFVLDIMDEEQTKGTHWHPYDVERAVKDISEFMDGRSDYELARLPG
ncbi:MAG: hypothetical protein IKM61_07405 [Eubacteriaceae bacterium]|nr:hypothetical protein [Eubacteriaceae bacterium]